MAGMLEKFSGTISIPGMDTLNVLSSSETSVTMSNESSNPSEMKLLDEEKSASGRILCSTFATVSNLCSPAANQDAV